MLQRMPDDTCGKAWSVAYRMCGTLVAVSSIGIAPAGAKMPLAVAVAILEG
jgi:hypothetical protein